MINISFRITGKPEIIHLISVEYEDEWMKLDWRGPSPECRLDAFLNKRNTEVEKVLNDAVFRLKFKMRSDEYVRGVVSKIKDNIGDGLNDFKIDEKICVTIEKN